MSEPHISGLHACLQAFPGAVVELSLDGIVTDSNGKLEQLLTRALIGRPFADVLDVTSQHKWARLLAHEPTTADGGLWEFNVESREGLDLRTFAVVWAPGEPGARLWLMEYARDLRLVPLYEELSAANSELVRTQRALSKESARIAHALRLQEAAVHLRDDVLAIVAHDLRNPLDRISAGVVLLLDDTFDAASRPRLLAVMERTVAGMNRLVRDLLDAASIDAGHLALDLRRVDVTALLENARETYSPRAEEKLLRLDCHAEDAFFIHADQGRILQLLGNLLSNAIRLTTPRGQIDIRAARVDDMVELSISDTGPGIAPQDLPHVFERFWQGRREARGSAGLGLAIGKGIVEGHGGRMWVESVVGRGTTFSFTVPMDHGDTAPDASRTQPG